MPSRSIGVLSPVIFCPVSAIYPCSFPVYFRMLPALFGNPSFLLPAFSQARLPQCRSLCPISYRLFGILSCPSFLPFDIPVAGLGYDSLSRRVESLVDFESYVFRLRCELIPNSVFKSL